MTYSFSSIADRNSTSSVTLPSTTLRYGVSRKPYSLVRAYTASELIRPMFGPSGVSIGADAAVMGRMHVAHFEAGALARQAARAKRRDATLVRDFRQRVVLVHELRQLRGAEELLDRARPPAWR